jgi:voltage-gated potassium channel
MADKSSLERRFTRALARATTPRHAAVIIAAATSSIAIGAGLLMTIIDHEHFPSVGSGLWWAVQTITTVGYGDKVPTTAGGRFVAAFVMLVGIGFVTVITASITSSFVTRSSQEQTAAEEAASTADRLRVIDERLERIEAALRQNP